MLLFTADWCLQITANVFKYAGLMCSHKTKTWMPSSVKMLRRLLARASANSLCSDRAPTRAAMLAFSTDPAYGFVFMRNTFARLCYLKR